VSGAHPPTDERSAPGRSGPGRPPLDGVVVVDLTTALAGPYATLLLAGLGARVIKVERPGAGETARSNPPYAGPAGLVARRTHDEDMSLSILARGRGKEAVTLDLKQPAGVKVLQDLVRHADVLVENFSAGVTERLGIDPPAMLAVNPRLVYTSISGFGAGNPGKAMDSVIQALSGMMLVSGAPGDDPVRIGLPVGDLVAPLYALAGTLAALREAERSGTGQHVDVSMLGALTAPLVRARREVVPLEHPDLGEIAGLVTGGVPIVFSASTTGFARPAPRVGEHNAAVYGGLLGYSDARLSQLAADGVL